VNFCIFRDFQVGKMNGKEPFWSPCCHAHLRTSLESWLIRGIIAKWPYFRFVNYDNLPRLYWQGPQD
jgi:hypothetical protein